MYMQNILNQFQSHTVIIWQLFSAKSMAYIVDFYNLSFNKWLPIQCLYSRQCYHGNWPLGALDGVTSSDEKSSGTIRLWRRSNWVSRQFLRLDFAEKRILQGDNILNKYSMNAMNLKLHTVKILCILWITSPFPCFPPSSSTWWQAQCLIIFISFRNSLQHSLISCHSRSLSLHYMSF